MSRRKSVHYQLPKKPGQTRSTACLVLLALLTTSFLPALAWNPFKRHEQDSREVEKKLAVIEKMKAEPVEQQRHIIHQPTPPKEESPKEGFPVLKGSVNYLVPKGTGLKLKLATVPTLGLRLLDRDLEGNLRPARENQKITAKISEDLFVDDNRVIPEGTIFYGKVTRVYPPRRLGRPGHLELRFERFETPDGRSFAFRAEANNFRESTWKSKAKGLGRIAAHAAGGAAAGALIAYQLFGPEYTMALDGYNIAGGAALGALGGTAYAIMSRGKKAVLEPGDDLNMEIDANLLLPGAVDADAKKPPARLPGLEMQILKTKQKKDGLGAYLIKVKALVVNNSAKKLNSVDLYLEDTNGERHPVCSEAEEGSEIIFHIPPHTMKRMHCDFRVEFPKLKYKLVWVDHFTRQLVYETPLPR